MSEVLPGLVQLSDLLLQLMPLILVLCLLLAQELVQLVDLLLNVNALLSLLLLLNGNLCVHLFAYVSHPLNLILVFASELVSLLLNLPQQVSTAVHFSIHRFNHLLSLLYCILVHLQLIILILSPNFKIQALFLFDLKLVKQVRL